MSKKRQEEEVLPESRSESRNTQSLQKFGDATVVDPFLFHQISSSTSPKSLIISNRHRPTATVKIVGVRPTPFALIPPEGQLQSNR